MKTNHTFTSTGKIGKSLLLSIPIVSLNFLFLAMFPFDFSKVPTIIAFSATILFFNYLFIMILYTGKTDTYRSAGFIVFSLFFALTFIVNLMETRGTNAFGNEEILACEIPFCHIPIPLLIIPAALTKTIIFPTEIGNIATMLGLVLGVSLSLGRGFCSWGCFYGGWDEGASRIARRPLIKKVNSVFRWTSFAILLIVALWSASSLTVEYCWWLCPFKAVTEYENVTSYMVVIKTIVFCSLFLGLVIILPFLTKKRIQCTTFCPMGAFLSLTNKINIFDIRIDKEKCTKCELCSKTCPTLSIDKTDICKTQSSITCTKCGKCIDVCKKQAINYHIKGVPVGQKKTLSRTVFLYPAFMLLFVMGGPNVYQGITIIIKLITTGSLI